MKTTCVSLALVEEKGRQIPGYLEEVVSAAFAKTQHILCFHANDYAALREKYKDYKYTSSSTISQRQVKIVKPPAPASGPGTELKKLLKLVGITATPNCSCNARAREMNARGCDWCEANLDTIVGWLREEAAKRKLPFIDAAGRLLIRRAIRNARRAAS